MPFANFVNTIEDYPYPYIIGGMCWEFPCVVPSDWSANHVQKPNNPDTVRDWKLALDAIVKKQGTFNLVFHPHGWIKAEQIVELIDHAVEKHGKKVKFLTFSECAERLNSNFCFRTADCATVDGSTAGTDSYRSESRMVLDWTVFHDMRIGRIDCRCVTGTDVRPMDRQWQRSRTRWSR